MYKPKTLGLWAMIFVLAILTSCVETIDFDQEYEPTIVVNCVMTTDSIQRLTLTYSNPLNQFYYEEVAFAMVRLFKDSIEIGQFEKYGFAKWQLKYSPKTGDQYSLKIEVPGYPNLEATTVMPTPVRIREAGGENSDTRRYFAHNLTSTPLWIFVLSQSSDSIMVTPQVMPGDQLQNSIGSDHPFRDGFNATDEMSLDNKGTTREHLAYQRIAPELTNGSEEIVFFVEADLSHSLVVFRSASLEYDLYLKSSVQKMLVYRSFDDPTQWFDESEIYSNITNGLGVFAACSDQIIQCSYRNTETFVFN